MPDKLQGTLWRLRCAEGHLRAIGDKITSGDSCENVLLQLTAVRGAVDAIALQLFNDQVERSKQVICNDPKPERRYKELQRLIALYDLWRKSNFDIARKEVNL